ncbi:DUF4192 family protein [Cnuibacter sp. UC19_7]|uniref:DUF4192 family protein n=1 Tax=Cnuibacter sp. UC19_7 TaxID=3350166 RepID=UPI00366C4D21
MTSALPSPPAPSRSRVTPALRRPGGELPLRIEGELGYRPTGSLVLVVERGRGSLMRADLPTPGGDAGDELGRALAGPLARERFAERVVPVVFAPAFVDTEGAWAHAVTAERVAIHLGRAGFVVLPGLVVAGEQWSPLDRVQWLPLRSGVESVVGGDVSADSAASAVPHPAPLARQRAAWAGLAAATPSAVLAVGRMLRALAPAPSTAAVESAAPRLSDVELVAVAHALDDALVRDQVVARVLGDLPGWWPAESCPPLGPAERARLTEAVVLLRRAASLAPESLLPPVLTVAALFEQAVGRAACARLLLGAALEQDRDYALAGLIARLAAAGQRPHPDERPASPTVTAPATPGSARRGGSARSRRTPAVRSSAGERVG